MKKIIFLLVLTMTSCSFNNDNLIKLQNHIRNCKNYSDLLSTYSRFNIFPSDEEVFVKTSQLILDRNISLFFNVSNSDSIEIIDTNNGRYFKLSCSTLLKTVIVKANEVDDIKETSVDTNVEYIITKTEKDLVIFDIKRNRLLIYPTDWICDRLRKQ